MRAKLPLLVVILLTVSGFLIYQRSRAIQRSPFPLGVAAAGMRYQELVDAEGRGEKLNLKCRPIASRFRICDADTDGPPGHILAAVNEQGRIAVLRMRFDDTTYKMRDLTSRMTNEWDEVGPRTTTSAEGQGDVLQWHSPDKRWSVKLLMRQSVPAPEWVLMRDETGIATSASRAVPALLVMAREGLVGDELLDALEKETPGSLLRAADTLSAAGRALAIRAATMPLCAPEPAIPVLPGSQAREALGEPAATIAEQAVALAFPGKHLSLGEAAYLVDSSGVAEQVSMTGLLGDDSGVRYVFALNYQSRADAVIRRARTFSTAGQCRAPSDLITVQLDSASETVTRATHAPVESEALSSRVTSALFHWTADGKSAIALEYLAQYGDDRFTGTIGWWALMPTDSMKVRSRLPLTIEKQLKDAKPLTGSFDYPTPEEGDEGPSGDRNDPGPLAGRRLDVITRRDGDTRTERVVIPSPLSGLPSGWAILSLF